MAPAQYCAECLLCGGTADEKALEWAEIYEGWKKDEVMVEEYMTEDAEFILTAYGSCGRICHTCVDELREAGYRLVSYAPLPPIRSRRTPTEK